MLVVGTAPCTDVNAKRPSEDERGKPNPIGWSRKIEGHKTKPQHGIAEITKLRDCAK